MASALSSNTIPTINPSSVFRTITDDVDLLTVDPTLFTILETSEGSFFCVTSFHIVPVSVSGVATQPQVTLVDANGRPVTTPPNFAGADEGLVINAPLVENPAPLCTGVVQASINTIPEADTYVVRFVVCGFYI